MKHRPHHPRHPRHPRPDHRVPAPGQVAYDPASGRTGVIEAVHTVAELLFDHQMTGNRVAFLRPEGGGVEWTADAAALRFPTPGQGDA